MDRIEKEAVVARGQLARQLVDVRLKTSLGQVMPGSSLLLSDGLYNWVVADPTGKRHGVGSISYPSFATALELVLADGTLEPLGDLLGSRVDHLDVVAFHSGAEAWEVGEGIYRVRTSSGFVDVFASLNDVQHARNLLEAAMKSKRLKTLIEAWNQGRLALVSDRKTVTTLAMWAWPKGETLDWSNGGQPEAHPLMVFARELLD